MLDDLRYRLRAIFHRREVERELAEELRFHVEQYADVEERAGVPRDEALRRARLAFGASASSRCGWRWGLRGGGSCRSSWPRASSSPRPARPPARWWRSS